MLMISKLKIAALMTAILLLPAGLGVYMLATANQPPAPAPLPVAAAHAIPADPATTLPSQPYSDAALTPFLNSHVAMIIAVDVPALDPAVIRARVDGMQFSDPATAQEARDVITHQVQIIPRSTRAGAKLAYAMLEFTGHASEKPVFVIPILPGADVRALARIKKPSQPGNQSTLNNAIVTSADIPQITSNAAEPRPDLAAALAAGNFPVRFVYVPSEFRNHNAPGDLANFGASSTLYPEPVWKDVQWCLLDIAPAIDHPSKAIYQCKDHETALALAKLLADKIAANQDSPVSGKPQFFDLFRDSQPQPIGNRVEIPLAPRNVDKIIIAPMLVG